MGQANRTLVREIVSDAREVFGRSKFEELGRAMYKMFERGFLLWSKRKATLRR